MRDESDAEENLSPGMTAHAPWRVVDVQPMSGLRIDVRFADGTCGHVDISGLVLGPNPGVFAGLRDPDVFERVHLDHGVVTWPGEIDIAPDAMYDEIKANGQWVLE